MRRIATIANVLDDVVVALIERLPTIRMAAAVAVWLRSSCFNCWFQAAQPAACFAPADLALANEADRVVEVNAVSASAAKRLHLTSS